MRGSEPTKRGDRGDAPKGAFDGVSAGETPDGGGGGIPKRHNAVGRWEKRKCIFRSNNHRQTTDIFVGIQNSFFLRGIGQKYF